jgi:hypothetical protein
VGTAFVHAARVRWSLLSSSDFRRTCSAAKTCGLPPTVWAHFWGRDWKKSTAFDRVTKTTIYDVRISRRLPQNSELHEARPSRKISKPSKPVRKGQSKASEGKACQRWLTEWMRTNRGRRIATYEKWYERAIEQWKTLSKRQFRNAWTTAIEKARAPAWSAEGAPRKADIKEVPEWPSALNAGPLLVETFGALVRDRRR